MFSSRAKKKAAWVQAALERFERPLLQYAQSILQDLDRARDTVQETFMRMHKQEQTAIEGHLSQCCAPSPRVSDRWVKHGPLRCTSQ
jgi:RNA polymerase sigma-70 factor (ECF subfamily)